MIMEQTDEENIVLLWEKNLCFHDYWLVEFLKAVQTPEGTEATEY